MLDFTLPHLAGAYFSLLLLYEADWVEHIQNHRANNIYNPEQGVAPLRATSGARVNADVRTENERCGTMLNKGATAMRMP